MYQQLKYLYSEGHFEDFNLNNANVRSDQILKFHTKYFKDTKFIQVNKFANLVYYLPYELNFHNSVFGLQTNDYLQISYFRENYSEINLNFDSSFKFDTGKKITVIFFLFPDDIEVKNFIF